MAHAATVYRCLIICPSDVEAEKQAIIGVLNHWNARIGDALGVQVQPVHWGYATPEMSGPAQSIINKQIVENCDLGIAIFWSRLGTKTREHESASVEEIRLLQQRGCRVAVYFNEAAVPQSSLKDDQYYRLQEQRRVFEKEGLLSKFTSIEQLCRIVTLDVTESLVHLARRDGSATHIEARADDPSSPEVGRIWLRTDL